MEYTIHSESLVYYALRNDNGYLCFIGGRYKIAHDLKNVCFFDSKSKAQEWIDDFGYIRNYENLQIRQVKVIDIGGVK